MVDCSNKNINLFFKYVKGELTRKEEYSIDRHVQSCEDCLLNFAYVEEIYTKKHLLSSDEKTLFIKYLSDPVWNSEIERVKKEIKSEINQEIKQQVINELVITQKEISKNEANLTSTKFQPIDFDTLNSNKKNKINKSFGSISSKSTYLAAAASIVVFAGLSTSIYLMLNKTTNQSQQLSVTTPPSILINNNTTSNLVDSINKISSNKPAKNNLYQELDLVIDEYLEHKDITFINKAKDISKEINNKYGDKYGVDLVKYYSNLDNEKLSTLLEYRKDLALLLQKGKTDNYLEVLKESKLLSERFESVDNFIESYKTKTLTNKFYVKSYHYTEARELTKEGLLFSEANGYLFLKLDFLLWQAKQSAETSTIEDSIKKLEEAFNLASNLELEDTLISAGMSLAGFYQKINLDLEAFSLAEKLINKTKGTEKFTLTISLFHIAGISAFNLKKYDISKKYLLESIVLSEKINDPSFLSRSYIFFSLTLAEIKDFNLANQYSRKAEETANSIQSEIPRLNTLSIVLAYKGKIKLIEGEFDKSVALYKNTLLIMEKIGVKNNLEISQINEALGKALYGNGQIAQAKEAFSKATLYQDLANQSKEQVNCLLAFIPMCNAN